MTVRDSALFRYRQDSENTGKDNESVPFFDARSGTNTVMVLPGRHYVTTNKDEMIVTLLGSCVAACIRDPIAAVGGLNHFLLPESENGNWGNTAGAAMRYGNHAMETLINDIIKRGGQRSRLEVKIFGGGQIIEGATTIAVGRKNIDFVRSYLTNEGFSIAAEHLGGALPRRIHYFPITGKVQMRQLTRFVDKKVFDQDKTYLSEIKVNDDTNDPELFD